VTREIIVGTAGHIDHGKTALVKALTGVDADRLPEEKRRGITIELGFAELELGDARIGFVDVPGHEKFVKNMLAGAHGIDLVALVIAADEGVMPQTREHFDICRLLATKNGVIILTKTDLVDAEMLELVSLEAAELVKDSFLENAPVAGVSAKTGAGIPELKNILLELIDKLPARQNETVTRLPIDRVFSVKGFGTVVTGTLVSGEINIGDELELLPPRKNLAAKRLRVRNLQVHGKAVENAAAGNRTAANLGGIDVSEIERGMLLAPVDSLQPTQSIDAEIEVLPTAARPLKSRQRVRVHLGTTEVLARLQIINEKGEIAPGEKGFAQLRMESAIVAIPGERFVIRLYSPQVTIAGGAVLHNAPARHRRKDLAAAQKVLGEMSAALTGGDKLAQLKLFLAQAQERGSSGPMLRARTGWRADALRQTIEQALGDGSAINADGVLLAADSFEDLLGKTLAELEDFHTREPLARGMVKETLREKLFAHLPPEVFQSTLGELETRGAIKVESDVVLASAHDRSLSPADEKLKQTIWEKYRAAGLEVPTLDSILDEAAAEHAVAKDHARRILQLLLDSGELLRVSPEMLFGREHLDSLTQKMRDFAAKSPDRLIDMSVFKDLAGVSRKYAIPLLEYFDREKITRRAGDKRLVL
jgi:selenocysteine-specific elongation factor